MGVGRTLRGGFRVLGLMMVLGGVLLIGLVLIGVVPALLVVCLLLLFYEVRVWLGTIGYGYVDSRDRLISAKRGVHLKEGISDNHDEEATQKYAYCS